MTRDEINRMAREAGLGHIAVTTWGSCLERFAALVAAHEREECAKVAKRSLIGYMIAKAIRARGKE